MTGSEELINVTIISRLAAHNYQKTVVSSKQLSLVPAGSLKLNHTNDTTAMDGADFVNSRRIFVRHVRCNVK